MTTVVDGQVRTGTHFDATLLQAMGMTEEELGQRKRFLQFGERDEQNLAAISELAQNYADPVIEAFYQHLLSHAESRRFFEDPKVLEYVKRMQRRYFLRLTQGGYDMEYVQDRLNIGAVHERIGLPIKTYLGAYSFYLREVAKRLSEAFAAQPERALELFLSLKKLVYLDMGLAIDTYMFSRERTIGLQQEAIRELSTPVLQVRDRLLILPIIGVIDSTRARQLTVQLLQAIRVNRAKVVVIDITGVAAVDSRVANHLVQTVEATRLMGATGIVTGLSSEVAQTLVTLGVDLAKVNTVGDLQGGIEEAERLLGYRVVSAEPNATA
jgi:rsbT co-antagonist protein RsbR